MHLEGDHLNHCIERIRDDVMRRHKGWESRVTVVSSRTRLVGNHGKLVDNFRGTEIPGSSLDKCVEQRNRRRGLPHCPPLGLDVPDVLA